MSTFIQLHVLTNYPPSNLNRDDLGRPKTAVMGGHQRLRISSQCLKRAWRTSDVFENALKGHIGTRTKVIGHEVYNTLVQGGINEKDAKNWAISIAEVFGKCKKDSFEIEQLAHFSVNEKQAIDSLTKTLIQEKRAPLEEELNLLRKNDTAVDIALFGRMLADKPIFNIEASAQVSHAITVHKVAVEDDFFTAVDDLNAGEEDLGAGHLGETEFGAGLFYLYVCINKDLLIENLGNNETLAKKAVRALTEAILTVSPTGKQNSFASRTYALYLMAEKGTVQPRSLASAFLKPVEAVDMASAAIDELKKTLENFNKVYALKNDYREINVLTGEGTLETILDFVSQ